MILGAQPAVSSSAGHQASQGASTSPPRQSPEPPQSNEGNENEPEQDPEVEGPFMSGLDFLFHNQDHDNFEGRTPTPSPFRTPRNSPGRERPEDRQNGARSDDDGPHAGNEERDADPPDIDLDISILEPPAFRETAPVRLAYLHAAISHIFEGTSFLDATNRLQGELDVIELCGALPTYPVPARTIVTAKRRLGLNSDDYINQRPICTKCFKYYPRDSIDTMQSPKCTIPRCRGIVYREKRMRADPVSGEAPPAKRYPAKIHAYSPLPLTIQRFLLRPDFVRNLRDTSQDLERPAFTDDTIMHDIHDGEQWTRNMIGLRRCIAEDGSVSDVEVRPGSKRPLVSCDVGLSMTFNMDW